jgi:hypothetical protein
MQYIVLILTFPQHLFYLLLYILLQILNAVMSTYHYYITVLRKVSFDADLFEKEYEKACNSMSSEDLIRLKNWHKAFLAKNPHLELIQ